MAYSNITVTNAALFNGATSLKSVLNNAGWTVTSGGSPTLSFTVTPGGTLYYKFDRLAADSPTFKVYISQDSGSTYVKYGTLTLCPGATYTGNIDLHSFSYTSPDTFNLVFGALVDGKYYYQLVCLGYIARFDTNDSNAWGLYISGAPEAMGKNFLSQGISYGTLETFFMRSVDKSSSTSKSIIQFKFTDIQDYTDSVGMGYNGLGTITNVLSASNTNFSGNSLRDIYETEKIAARRFCPIGVYKEYLNTLFDGQGLRGTLRNVYSVHQFCYNDSAGNIIPHVIGKQALAATFNWTARGSAIWSSEKDWLVVPLYNNVTNYDIYNGLHVVALPKV
jgi:hypothetical protein